MSWIICLCVLGVDPSPENEPRRITTIRREMSAAMQQEAGAKSDPERSAAIYRMTELYRELKRDPRLPLSDTLQAYKAELWSRLTRVQTRLERRFQRESQGRPRPRVATSPPSVWGGSADFHASQSLAEHVDLVGQSMGGPLALMGATRWPAAPAAGGAAGPPDFGPALVDLIQRTISPDSWDVNGGPGTIVYYRAFHCLVVRARGEVHEAIGGALGALGK